MIRHLVTRDVGPSRKLEFTFAPRLNILTGDNGLGKTFILDVIWWLMTGTWIDDPAFPWNFAAPAKRRPEGQQPLIGVALGSADLTQQNPTRISVGSWHWDRQKWDQAEPAPPPSGKWLRNPTRMLARLMGEKDTREFTLNQFSHSAVVLYGRSDGTYALWDPYLRLFDSSDISESATILTTAELWRGKTESDPKQGTQRIVTRGLIEDWVSWQRVPRSAEFFALRKVLHFLSPPGEQLVPGEPSRVHRLDRRDIPTLDMSSSVVPTTLTSAGTRRVLSLAYLLVWTWMEHTKAAHSSRRPTSSEMIVLLDEPELHLHPSWQRTILPALLEAIGAIAPNVSVQVFSTTHSPLVLASLEHIFKPDLDKLFTFDLTPRSHQVEAKEVAWRPRGDVSNWLTSDVFDLEYARSLEAEKALKEAVSVLDRPDLTDRQARRIHNKLHKVLGDTDPFWTRWLEYAKAKGIEP